MKKIVKGVFILIILSILAFVSYTILFKKEEVYINMILNDTESEEVILNKYFIYGQNLNIEGTLTTDSIENIKDIKIVFKSIDNELEYSTIYYINEKTIDFISSNEINNSINLDNVGIDNYYILLKVIYENNAKYYTINNNSEYQNLEYYTITKDNKNNKILINSGTSKFNNKKYMDIKVKNVELPENVYDIVLDAGHGGKDSGAVNGKYYEKDITLEYAIDLKEELEKLGLKVKLTRDGSNEEEFGIYNIYGENGRAVIPNKVKAKYTFSIHLNSAPYNLSTGGVEIYAPTKSNLEFASMLADNIVKSANTTYSPNEVSKIRNGVYVRILSEEDINLAHADAKNNGYEPYDIKPDTPYYFMIRETGGIATNAYADGRNKNYGKNIYYDSNYGTETYLIELGFMVSAKDFNNILNNKKGYIDGLSNSIKNYLNL